MSTQARRERERADRERLIVTTARELAETEGWEAVTTRRLAERVEYSQPVLYSHFKGKDAIMAAVALEGFTELAAQMRAARTSARKPPRALAAVAEAYIAFAEQHPALYDAMFSGTIDLPWATPETPAPMQDCFEQILRVVRPIAADDDEGMLTEVVWAGLHGLVTLTRGGRLPREAHTQRLALLLDRFTRFGDHRA